MHNGNRYSAFREDFFPEVIVIWFDIWKTAVGMKADKNRSYMKQVVANFIQTNPKILHGVPEMDIIL